MYQEFNVVNYLTVLIASCLLFVSFVAGQNAAPAVGTANYRQS